MTEVRVEGEDASEAARWAEQALELATEEEKGWIWTTLGMARYRAADHEAAIDAIEHGMKVVGLGDASDFSFLAMAHEAGP